MRKIISALGRNAVSPYNKITILPKVAHFLIFISLFAIFPVFPDPISQIYKTGASFQLTASRFGLSAEGIMEVMENAKFQDADVILVRSQITKMGGLMGFLIKFLRIYKESNTFDSYIDSNTLMAVRYEVYKLNKDGSKKPTEHVYFDRENKRIISLENNQIIVSNVAPDTQDAFSIFLSLLKKINTEKLFVGKTFEINLYAYKKVQKLNIEVTDLIVVGKTDIYTLVIKDLPAIFKYPASLEIKVTNIDDKFLFPVYGKCIIHIPIFPNIKIEGRLSKIE